MLQRIPHCWRGSPRHSAGCKKNETAQCCKVFAEAVDRRVTCVGIERRLLIHLCASSLAACVDKLNSPTNGMSSHLSGQQRSERLNLEYGLASISFIMTLCFLVPEPRHGGSDSEHCLYLDCQTTWWCAVLDILPGQILVIPIGDCSRDYIGAS